MRISGARAWVKTVLAFVALAAATVTARAEQIADRFDQARLEGVVVVYAATDLEVVKPVIDDFEALHPGVRVQYHDMHSAQLHARVVDEARRGVPGADVVWSSAMDLQVKLVNDGHAQPHRSAETAALPRWAVWKDEAFGTTYEPAVIVYNKRLLDGADVPGSHAELTRRSCAGASPPTTPSAPASACCCTPRTRRPTRSCSGSSRAAWAGKAWSSMR